MIVCYSDPDGDEVMIESGSIVAVSVGDLRKPVAVDGDPRHVGQSHRVTLIHTLAGPIIVRQSLEAVVTAWQAALRATDALGVREVPGAYR